MNRRSFPLWLLRDLPALIGIALSSWPLMILMISNGRKAARGKRVDPGIYDALMTMLPMAEARLRYALYRQAFRAFGWNPRLILLEHLPPITSWSDFGPRFEAYRLAIMDLRQAAIVFTDILRDQYRLRTHLDANTVRPAHASTDAARCAAAQHELVGVAGPCVRRRSSLRSAQRTNWSGGPIRAADGVLANARGPPPFQIFQNSAHAYPRSTPLLRTPPRAYAPPRCSSRTALMYDHSMCAATPR
jgi:hypothetical protein